MKIIDVPEKMQKFYGTGKMLHPDVEMVEEQLKSIPMGKVTLVDALCKKLSSEYGTDVACPMRTTAAIKKITESYIHHESNDLMPYWRIVRTNHLLINSPYLEICASKLGKEGFTIDMTNKGNYKVTDIQDRIFD